MHRTHVEVRMGVVNRLSIARDLWTKAREVLMLTFELLRNVISCAIMDAKLTLVATLKGC